MGNPFEDLRQAVVVRPMNSPGPQGAEAPEMKIQYSYNGTSWHDNPAETDKYLRFSTDNGVTWSEAIYFNNLYETLAWVDKARQWATNPENNPVEDNQYSALHHAAKAARSEFNAEAAALDAAASAAEAFGAAAPAWDSETVYNYNDVVSFDNGHTYRCIGTDIIGPDHAPNINGVDNEVEWTRITVAPDGFFELDEYGDFMPRLTPLVSELFTLDENGDIMHKDPIDIEFGDDELYPVSGKLEFIDSIHDFRNASFASTTENVYLNGYYGAGTPGGGMFYRDSESAEADNSGTIIVDGDGIRWKRANVHEEYYASWFGVSTDIDDNSPLIENALNAIPEYSILTFGPGTYNCKQTITWPDSDISHRTGYVKHISIQGSVKRAGNLNVLGTIIQYNGPPQEELTPFIDFRGSTKNKVYACSILNIIFASNINRDTSNIIGLWFYDCQKTAFKHINCRGFEVGIQIESYFYHSSFYDVTCAYNNYGFKAYGTGNHAVFYGCNFSHNNIVGFSDGLGSGGGSGISLNDCYFESNGTGVKSYVTQSIRITRCYFEHNVEYNIDIECSNTQSQPIIYVNNSYFCFYDSYMPSNRAIIRITSIPDVTTTCVITENVIHKGVTAGYLDYFIYITDGDIIIKAENNMFNSSSVSTQFPICSQIPLESSYFNNKCFIV